MVENSVFGGNTWGDPVVVAGRAQFFADFLFKEEIFGPNPSAYIADYCEKAHQRLKLYSKRAQDEYAGNERALIHLAGKVKYALAHLALAECYGKQLGIVSENQLFRQHALAFVSMVHAETEALEDFHY